MYETGGVGERTGHKLERKQPRRIDRPRQHDLPARDWNEAEPAVIGHVANEHDEAKALRPGACDPLIGKRLAVAIAFICRVYDERTEEKRFSSPPMVRAVNRIPPTSLPSSQPVRLSDGTGGTPSLTR